MWRRWIESDDETETAERLAHAYQPAIPLGHASLCLDCEVVYEGTGRKTCPSCGSAAAWPIRNALNRDASAPAQLETGIN
jgi:hypothetical protein